MNLDDWYLIWVSICIGLVIVAFSPLVMAYIPKGREQFFALAVLGEEGMAEQYFPNDDINIEIGEQVRWQIYLYNHMGKARYVSVKFKILNSTMISANSTLCSASVAPMIYEVRKVLLDDEALIFPLQWSLQNITTYMNITSIDRIIMNEKVIQTYVEAKNERTFRIVIELWVYEMEQGDFIFGWTSGKETRCAWNQIWFNTTTTN